MAAPVWVVRGPVRDRLDNEVIRDAWDESRTSADGDACRRFFRTDAAACPHRAVPLTCRGRRVRVPLSGHAGQGGEGLSARRRDADSPLLARHALTAGEVENRAAGVVFRA
jgi:hypothetical protein